MESSSTPRQESPWSREIPVRVPQGIYPEANTDSLMIMGTEMLSIAVTSHRLFGCLKKKKQPKSSAWGCREAVLRDNTYPDIELATQTLKLSVRLPQ